MDFDEQFKNLYEKLKTEKNWPQVYMFKFIITADNKKMALVESKFSDEAIIHQKESSGGKYMSITVKEVMLSPEAVIEKYREMSTIEGVMSI
jgi:putative lipoic acid-binding regulatory protein